MHASFPPGFNLSVNASRLGSLVPSAPSALQRPATSNIIPKIFQFIQFNQSLRIIERDLNNILGEFIDLLGFRIIDLTRQ